MSLLTSVENPHLKRNPLRDDRRRRPSRTTIQLEQSFKREARLYDNQITGVYSCVHFLLRVHGRHVPCPCNAPKISCGKGTGYCNNRLGDDSLVNGSYSKLRRAFVLRILMGCFEAPIFPYITTLVSMGHTKKEQPTHTAI
jgi:hypothetical protein